MFLNYFGSTRYICFNNQIIIIDSSDFTFWGGLVGRVLLSNVALYEAWRINLL